MKAAVFPGQGSQNVGMGKELFDNFKVFKESFEEASDALSLDFKKLCFQGPEETLRLTENTQPAILACSVSTFKTLQSEFDFKPDFVAGHSVGEYSALVSSGVIDFSTALKAVKLRGASMQEAVPVGVGAMAALIGPSDEQAVELCKWVESENPTLCLQAANFNCPGQVVLSGHQEALDWLNSNLKSYEFSPAPRKVRLIPLKVSAPFHSKLMMPAQEKMKAFFDLVGFKTPEYKLIQNVTAKLEEDPEQIKSNIITQVSESVLWTKTIELLKESALKSYIEVGSGTTLSGLIKKIDSDTDSLLNTSDLDNFKSTGSFLDS